MTVMQTVSGAMIDLLNPSPASISLIDIATGLSNTNRFVGQTISPWSVLSHSYLVAAIARARAPEHLKPMAELAGLLHDAHEACIGDISSPMKRALKALFHADVDAIAQRVQRSIHIALSIPIDFGTEIAAIVRHADMVALATERRDLMARAQWDESLPDPCADRIWDFRNANNPFRRYPGDVLRLIDECRARYRWADSAVELPGAPQ